MKPEQIVQLMQKTGIPVDVAWSIVDRLKDRWHVTENAGYAPQLRGGMGGDLLIPIDPSVDEWIRLAQEFGRPNEAILILDAVTS